MSRQRRYIDFRHTLFCAVSRKMKTRSVRQGMYALGAGIISCVLAGQLICLAPVYAAPFDELQEISETLHSKRQAYQEISAQLKETEDRIRAERAHIDELIQELPELKHKAQQSLRTLYKMNQNQRPLLHLLLSTDTFSQLITMVQYLDALRSHNMGALNELQQHLDELHDAEAVLIAQQEQLKADQERAAQELKEAESARVRLEAAFEATQAAEAKERTSAIQIAQSNPGQSFTTNTGHQVETQVPVNPNPGPVEWVDEKEAFISQWEGRINAYLAGSPLAGQGRTFAEAAWDYDVDPRFSPAISTVESSKGRYCFKPYNAWGWGSVSWSSWEEAIRAHTAGLARGYGGRLTYAGAKKYCPPNADRWYASVLANMEMI